MAQTPGDGWVRWNTHHSTQVDVELFGYVWTPFLWRHWSALVSVAGLTCPGLTQEHAAFAAKSQHQPPRDDGVGLQHCASQVFGEGAVTFQLNHLIHHGVTCLPHYPVRAEPTTLSKRAECQERRLCTSQTQGQTSY